MRRWIVLLAVPVIALIGPALRIAAEDEPTPHSIIDRALKAGGGASKIAQFKAISFKADANMGGDKYKVTGLFAGPTLFRLEMTIKDEPVIMVGSGDAFWVKTGKNDFEETSKNSENHWGFEAAIRLFYGLSLPDRLLSLKDKTFKLTILGEQAANGVNTVVLRASHALHPEATIFFDKESGLPIKTLVKLPPENPNKGLFQEAISEVETYFDDYKEVQGVKHFTKVRMCVGKQSIEAELREIKLLKKYDPESFKKPR